MTLSPTSEVGFLLLTALVLLVYTSARRRVERFLTSSQSGHFATTPPDSDPKQTTCADSPARKASENAK